MNIKLDSKISTLNEYFIKHQEGMCWQVGVKNIFVRKSVFDIKFEGREKLIR